MTDSTFQILTFKGSDLPINYQAMIYSKWLRSLRNGNDLFKAMVSNDYYTQYHKFLRAILLKPDCLVRIAVLTENKDIALGFSVSREDVLDYVYVQPEQRGQKLLHKLIPKNITTFTHMTKTWLPIWQSSAFTNVFKDWKFNPFA